MASSTYLGRIASSCYKLEGSQKNVDKGYCQKDGEDPVANNLNAAKKIYATRWYFSISPELKAPYVGAADLIKSKNCSTIGLHLGLNDWEYPLWVLLQQDNRDVLRLEHVNVENSSAETASATEEFIPCAVISIGPDGGAGDEFTINQQRYTREWSSGTVSVYFK